MRVARARRTARRRQCVTRPARPADPRAWCTRTGRWCCTRWPRRCPTRWAFGAGHAPAGRADVPRQRVGPALRRGAARRAAGATRAEAGSGERARPDRHEKVTMTAGVPTVWMAMLDALDAQPHRWDLAPPRSVDRRRSGGAAQPARGVRPPRSDRRPGVGNDRDLAAGHGRAGCPLDLDERDADEQYDYRARQGVAMPVRRHPRARTRTASSSRGTTRAMGELEVRGPWVAAATTAAGRRQFHRRRLVQTGDVVRIDHTAASGSATAPRTWSSPAASGSPRSIWRTSSWLTRPWRRPR